MELGDSVAGGPVDSDQENLRSVQLESGGDDRFGPVRCGG